MREDPYVRGKITPGAYAHRIPVLGQVVAVLRGNLSNRNLELIPQPSRAVRAGDVHELIVTDEEACGPGSRVGPVAYLAFVEFLNGGVLLAEDLVTVNASSLGRLAGFDMSHFPNHMNIVVRGDLTSGEDRGLILGQEVVFQEMRST